MADKPSQVPRISVDGSPLNDADASRLIDAVIDDDLNMPDMFELRFRDPQRDFVARMPFRIGSRVVIKAGQLGATAATVLIDGEVTSVETNVGSAGAFLSVTGYDQSHRLHRGKKSVTFNDVTDADLVNRLARAAGVDLGTVTATDVTHKEISQWLESDWEFLRRRALETGRLLFVRDGKLHFIKPEDAPPGAPVEARYGDNLLEFNGRISSNSFADKIEVVGWDVEQVEAIKQQETTQVPAAVLSDSPFDPAAVGQPFGSFTYVSASRALGTEAEAQQAMLGVQSRVGSAPMIADGVMVGNPAVAARATVTVAGTGRAFDGNWWVSHSRHLFDRDGYTTHFTGSGFNDCSLSALITGTDVAAGGQAKLDSVMIGLVSDNDDPQKAGRVKLVLPYLEMIGTSWARVVSPGGGAKRGFVNCPEVGDEVLVAFEHGDIDHPFVLGGLYNGKAALELDGYASSDGNTIRRAWTSRNGHRIEFVEDPQATSDDRIEVTTSGGTKVIIRDDGTVTIDAKKVEVTASETMTLKASQDLKIEGQNVTIKAQQNIELAGSAGATVKSDGQTEIKGAMVNLN